MSDEREPYDPSDEPLAFINPSALANHFPFAPRGNQSWVLEQVEAAIIRPEIKYVVIQAPTGSGKSPIAMALARSVEKAYILTSMKLLQDQYAKDFIEYISDMRGRANYESENFKGYNCADCPCRTKKALKGKCSRNASEEDIEAFKADPKNVPKPFKKCGYYTALEEASRAQIASMNFAAGLAFMNFTQQFTKRNLMIIDEAHMIEDQLTNFIEFTVEAEKLREHGIMMLDEKIPDFGTPREYILWLQEMSRVANELEEKETYRGDYDQFEILMRKLSMIKVEMAINPENMVMQKEVSESSKSITKISFRPIDVSRYAEEKLFQYGDKTVFLSATIINYEAFIESLGISRDECVFIDVPSTFPKENRPIKKAYVGRLSYKTLDGLKPDIIAKIIEIMALHQGEKGIIHVPSYDLATSIVCRMQDGPRKRILFPKSAKEQAGILARHANTTEPTVLLSPSLSEGVDLKEDLSRFQIIVKMPFPSTKDPIVEARMNKSKSWYDLKTTLKLVQSYGRSVRSETDTAITYVLDQCFDDILRRNAHSLPIWFKEAVEGGTGSPIVKTSDALDFLAKLRSGR